MDLDSFGAVGVAGLVRGTAVGAADRWVGAGWASPAAWDHAWVVFGLVGFGADCAVGPVPAQGGGVAVALAVVALGASAIGDVFVELAFTVADGAVVASDIGLLDTARQGYNDRGG